MHGIASRVELLCMAAFSVVSVGFIEPCWLAVSWALNCITGHE